MNMQRPQLLCASDTSGPRSFSGLCSAYAFEWWLLCSVQKLCMAECHRSSDDNSGRFLSGASTQWRSNHARRVQIMRRSLSVCVCVTVEKKPHLLWCNQQPGFSEYSRLTSPLTLPKWCPVTVSVNLPVPYSYCPLFAIINSPAGQTSLWSGVTGKSGPAVWGWSRGHSRGRGGGGSGSELSPCGWGRPQRRGSLRSRELPVLI